MLLQENIVRKLNADLEREHYTVIKQVVLPAYYFRATGKGNASDILLMRTTEGYFHIYIDEDVKYLGSGLPPYVFTNEVRDGWQRLDIPNNGEIPLTLRAISIVLGLDGNPPRLPVQKDKNRKKETGDIGKMGEFNASLHKFGKNLTLLAQDGKLSPVIGRDKEIKSVVSILLKHGKNAPLLIGEPGVGKTAIVEGLAQNISEGKIINELRDSHIFEVNLGFLSAGASMKGELEERVKNIVNAAKVDPDIILFFDELHTICSNNGDNDIATLLKSDLARGTFKVIGATTYRDYKQSIEKDGALARRFQQVLVKEPSEEETIEMIMGLRQRLEAHHGVGIPDETIKEAVKLSSFYITDRYLPDKAIDLIDQACVKMRLS